MKWKLICAIFFSESRIEMINQIKGGIGINEVPQVKGNNFYCRTSIFGADKAIQFG
jgi:hypothetical protein